MSLTEFVNKNPHLKKISDYTIFESRKDFLSLALTKSILVGVKSIPFIFLKRILSNDKYFEYACNYLSFQSSDFKIGYVMDEKYTEFLCFSRSEIGKGLMILLEDKNSFLNEDETKRARMLINYISYESFLKKYSGKMFSFKIDGFIYIVSFKSFLYLINLSIEDFESLCKDETIKFIDGIPKKHMIYAFAEFINNESILKDYLVSDDVRLKYEAIKSNQLIDLEAINKHLETKDTLFQKIHIDKSLEDAILSGIPVDFNDLEKAIYIYIKMCRIFTYNEEYFTKYFDEDIKRKHKDLSYVDQINLFNNEAVCFEFNIIYAAFLNRLGIKFKSNYMGYHDEVYGEGHVKMEFRWGKFLVRADAVSYMTKSDLTYAKVSQPLIGLVCLNKNKETQEEFEEALNKVYMHILREENVNSKTDIIHISFFEEILNEFFKIFTKLKDIRFEERISIMVRKANNMHLKGVDYFSYLLQLQKILFTPLERQENIEICMLANNLDNEDKKSELVAIITINFKGFNNKDLNLYYILKANGILMPLLKEELEGLLNVKKLEYIDEFLGRIPGVAFASKEPVTLQLALNRFLQKS